LAQILHRNKRCDWAGDNYSPRTLKLSGTQRSQSHLKSRLHGSGNCQLGPVTRAKPKARGSQTAVNSSCFYLQYKSNLQTSRADSVPQI